MLTRSMVAIICLFASTKRGKKESVLPVWGDESVAHIHIVNTGVLQFLAQHISHGALQQPRHFLIAVSVKYTITCFHTVSKPVHSQHRHTQPVPDNRPALRNRWLSASHTEVNLIHTSACNTAAAGQGKQQGVTADKRHCCMALCDGHDPGGAARHTKLSIVMHLTLLQALNPIELLGSTAPATLKKGPLTALMPVLGACQWLRYWLSDRRLLCACTATSKQTDIQYIQCTKTRFKECSARVVISFTCILRFR